MSAYPWRGLSLDIARSFFPPTALRRLIDRLSDLGLNILHLHLTDDQGWRIEIPGRPALTEMSGRTAVRGASSGWLTVGDWVDLAEYAEGRGLTLVPEIDLPGHVNAALHALPELNPGPAPAAYDGTEGTGSRLEPTLSQTEDFLRDVIGAVARITPGRWIHIGGDECLGLSDADYRTLVSLAANLVNESGKQPVAWQEAALAGLGDQLILQLWHIGSAADHPEAANSGEADPIAALADRTCTALLEQAGRGAAVILSPAPWTYFDMKQVADATGQAWAGTLTLDKASTWDPPATLPGLDPGRILGVEAAMWTEFVHTETALYDMLFPRLTAFARIAQGLAVDPDERRVA